MRSTAKTSLRLLSFCAAAFGSVWIGTRIADDLEWRSLAAVSNALAEAGYPWATVTTDGVIARISGEAPDEASRFRVMTTASAVLNPVNLRDGMTVVEVSTLPPPQLRLELLRSGNALTIHGLIPATTDDALTLAQQITALKPDLRLSDLVAPVDLAAPEGWPETLAASLTAMAALDNSRVLLTPDAIQISGLAPATLSLSAFDAKLRAMLPPGVSLSLDLRAPRKVVSPFIARFRLTPEGGVTEACAANTDSGRQMIEAAAAAAGIDVVGRCAVVLGAPDASWDQVVVTGLNKLAAMGDGTLTLSDLQLTLVPGPAAEPVLTETALEDLESSIPGIFSVNVPIGLADPAEGAESELEFRASRNEDGAVIIHGPLPDRDSIAVVQSLARAQFHSESLSLDLRQQAGLPDKWTLRILAALDQFSAIEEGSLSVSPSMIEIDGTSGSKAASTEIAAGLTAALGMGDPFRLKIDYDRLLDPIAALPSPQECIDRVRAIQSETKITFAPGSVELDAASSAIVRKIADVLRKCSDVPIEIGGHTDSQGRDEMNEKLSQQRADAVLRALIAQRVLSANLTAKGYGEARPDADNGTADGREANRRIEFALLGTSQTEDDAPTSNPTEPENGPN
ncbi:OmpA family protein [Pseudoruegeria sp. SK021]|uniref:OmpA family protein n=1 Tax=Pseudoruegeria sp. SK021 TaxID=1933035 RepID=UPI000A2155BD|nr:OmpA family protein [Pseudoruegeria sp. SK021]OSP55714.1 hypothetical protein BV911_06295 [Pseudoruegeria sp. SK021]